MIRGWIVQRGRKPTFGGGRWARGSGDGHVFEMPQPELLPGQVEKEPEERKKSIPCDKQPAPCKQWSAAERNRAGRCMPGPSLWGFGGPPGDGGDLCVCRHLSEFCLPLSTWASRWGGGGVWLHMPRGPRQPPDPCFPCPSSGGARRPAHRGAGRIASLAVDGKPLLHPLGVRPGWAGRRVGRRAELGARNQALGRGLAGEKLGTWEPGVGRCARACACVRVCVREARGREGGHCVTTSFSAAAACWIHRPGHHVGVPALQGR